MAGFEHPHFSRLSRRESLSSADGKQTCLKEMPRGDLHPSSGDWGKRNQRREQLPMRTPTPSPNRSRGKLRHPSNRRASCDADPSNLLLKSDIPELSYQFDRALMLKGASIHSFAGYKVMNFSVNFFKRVRI